MQFIVHDGLSVDGAEAASRVTVVAACTGNFLYRRYGGCLGTPKRLFLIYRVSPIHKNVTYIHHDDVHSVFQPPGGKTPSLCCH